MNNHEDHISLEVNEVKNQYEVFLHLDESALEILIKDLQRLQNVGDHTHYMTDEWGGVSLANKVFDDKNKLVHHFQITRI